VNLLDNARKFTRHRESPRIEVGTADAAGERVFFVRDNGVGFDVEGAARLFEPFRRLHGGGFKGHGVGLSIVKRIVERHGGRLWADSRRGEGATFCSRWPRQRAANDVDDPVGVVQRQDRGPRRDDASRARGAPARSAQAAERQPVDQRLLRAMRRLLVDDLHQALIGHRLQLPGYRVVDEGVLQCRTRARQVLRHTEFRVLIKALGKRAHGNSSWYLDAKSSHCGVRTRISRRRS
jgi:hypothetical protein